MKLTIKWFEHFYIITIAFALGIIIDDTVTNYLRTVYAPGYAIIVGDIILGVSLFIGAYVQLHYSKNK